MSKSTETTNDRVPRVLVRFGKHPSSVGKHPSSAGKRGGAPRRAGLSERGDAGRGGYLNFQFWVKSPTRYS